MTSIFFALSSHWSKTLKDWPFEENKLNFLVTFADKKLIESVSDLPRSRMMLDSGAFSAWNRGAVIDIDELIKETKNPKYTDCVCLDVVGDPDASVKNAMYMKANGSKAFPVFHYGDPWDHLAFYKDNFNRVGLSCRFGEKPSESMKWLEQCFARAWPCRFHSFGWTAAEPLSEFPFDTADSTSWMNPVTFGWWRSFSKQHSRHFGFFSSKVNLKTRGVQENHLCSEIRAWLKVQSWLQHKWKKQLSSIGV